MKRVLSIFSCLGVITSVVSCSPSASVLEPSAIYAKAKEFTVQIDGEETGTGTIIEENNGTYTVLTCWHVMDTPGNYQITTADGSTHQVSKVENLPDVDLAIITFSSDNTYSVAKLGDSATATSGFSAYIVGYPDPFPGIPERSYFTDSAEIQSRLTSVEKGYQIVHSGSFTPGSSGGGMFDSEARLVAVNGQFISEGNTGKAYGTGIPLEIYLDTKNNFTVPTNVTAPQDFVSVGKRKLKQEDYQGAIAEFDKALAANPNDINSLYARSLANFDLQNFTAAISDLDRVIELNPNDAVAYYSRGNSYDSLEDYQSAIADLDEAIRLDPQFASAYNNRGSSYYNLGDYQNAIADLDEAIRLNPQFAVAYSNRGNSYRSLGDYQNAIADYDEAIRLNPQLALAYNNRGSSYYNLGDYQNAIANYDEAIRLTPQFAVAYNNRGNIYRSLGNYQNALADLDEAIRLDPNYADAYYSRGFSYKNIDNNSFAIKDFKLAAELYQKQGNTQLYEQALAEIKGLQ